MDFHSAKGFIELVNTLRDLGLNDLDLPRVALIGMRNAKANVLETILGSAVDDSRHGCLFEYRLSHGGSPWGCKISVRSISEDNVPLQCPSVRPLGDVITKKAELPTMMKRAQVAALHPSIPMADVLSMPPNEMDSYLTTNFSLTYVGNTVCLELNGSDLTDLTLIEMPDLDLSFEHETRKCVENLVLTQLRGKCIIVAAIPMNEDIFSKRALHLAKQVDPDGARTIGILTNLGEQRIPECPNFALQLGCYYITASAKRNKRNTAEKPVAKVLVSSSPSNEQNSTVHLEVKLSFLLVEIIRETMPLLRIDVVHCLDQCQQEVACLPPAVTEPATYMLVMLTRLSDDIHRITRGTSESSPLLEHIHDYYADLRLAIRKTAPNFVPLLHSTPITQDIIDHLADGEEPCEKAKLVSPFYLDDMRKHIAAYATRDLPSHVPYPAKKALIKSFQNEWATLVSECLERVVRSVVKVVIERIQVLCQDHELLKDHLRSLLGELIRHHLNVCSEDLEAILEIELTPYTQHQLYLNSCSENWLSRYRDIRKGRIGANQKSGNPSSVFSKTTSTPSPQEQNIQRGGIQLTTSFFKSGLDLHPSGVQATPLLHGAENSVKNSPAQLSNTQKANPQDKQSAGSESSKAPTTSAPKTAEAPRAPPSPFTSSKPSEAPKLPTNPDIFGLNKPSRASNDTSAPVFGLTGASVKVPTGKSTFFGSPVTSTHSPSETETSAFTASTRNSTSNTTTAASSASILSTTPANPNPLPLRPTFKEGPTQKDLPFPINPISSEKSTKAKTADNPVKDSDSTLKAATTPSQPPAPVFTASNVGPSNTSRDPDTDYYIALSALSRLGFSGLTRADLEKLITADEYEDELKLMADVRGYFQIASMRVVDYVPAFIGLKFVRAVGSDILPFFMEKMGLGRPTANAICATYFAEDAEIVVKRERLTEIQVRLESAQLELYKFGL